VPSGPEKQVHNNCTQTYTVADPRIVIEGTEPYSASGTTVMAETYVFVEEGSSLVANPNQPSGTAGEQQVTSAAQTLNFSAELRTSVTAFPSSPEARATAESPSAPHGGDPLEGATSRLFEIRSAADLAGAIENQIDQVSNATRIIDRKLGEWVNDQGGLPSVVAATTVETALDLGRNVVEGGKNRLDILRLGEGIAQGTVMGVVEDLGRVADIAFPTARALRDMGGVAYSAAYKTVIKTQQIKELQNEVYRIVEKIYKEQIHIAMQNTRHHPMIQGTKADNATKRILIKEFEGVLEIYFDERTGITKGTKGGRTMDKLDCVFPGIALAIELKKSPKAMKEIQDQSFRIFCKENGFDLRYVYGHL
jgi:hypothetical protein